MNSMNLELLEPPVGLNLLPFGPGTPTTAPATAPTAVDQLYPQVVNLVSAALALGHDPGDLFAHAQRTARLLKTTGLRPCFPHYCRNKEKLGRSKKTVKGYDLLKGLLNLLPEEATLADLTAEVATLFLENPNLNIRSVFVYRDRAKNFTDYVADQLSIDFFPFDDVDLEGIFLRRNLTPRQVRKGRRKHKLRARIFTTVEMAKIIYVTARFAPAYFWQVLGSLLLPVRPEKELQGGLATGLYRDGSVYLPACYVKTGHQRMIDDLPEAWTTWSQFLQKVGAIVQSVSGDRWEQLRRSLCLRAGVTTEADIWRATVITILVDFFGGDIHKVADLAGNSPEIIQAHYIVGAPIPDLGRLIPPPGIQPRVDYKVGRGTLWQNVSWPMVDDNPGAPQIWEDWLNQFGIDGAAYALEVAR